MLPQMLIGHPEYRSVYKKHCLDPDQYIILDNGAAEGNMVSDKDLIELAKRYRPNEMAVPDTLANGTATLGQAERFFSHHSDDINVLAEVTAYGFVAQGRSVDECMDTVSIMVESWWGDYIDVIYLPRLLLERENNPTARLQLAIKIHQQYGERFQYHFFGASPMWPAEIRSAANVPWVRSMDTSAPYVLAYWKQELTLGLPEEGFSRPMGYFGQTNDKFQSAQTKEIVDTFIAWAGGQDGP